MKATARNLAILAILGLSAGACSDRPGTTSETPNNDSADANSVQDSAADTGGTTIGANTGGADSVSGTGGTSTGAAGSVEDVLAWPHQKFGVFVHYGFGEVPGLDYGFPITQYPDGSYPQSVDEVADGFDLQQFTQSMVQIDPEYLIFTAWHGGMFPLFPSQKMDEWVGEGHCSNRDLIGEVLDAMIAIDVDVILYTQPNEAKNFSAEQKAAVGYDGRNNPTFNDFVNDVYAEMIDRYGTKIRGMWFDSGSYKAEVDKERLRNTVLSRLPNAALIAIRAANNVADYGMAEIRRPYMFGTKEPYWHLDAGDVTTWPGLAKSVAFVNDQYWWSVPGNYSLDPEVMYKYTVLQAATNHEGGGVAWAVGPFPGADMWNSKVMPSMSALGQRVGAVGESIKGTYASTSYPPESISSPPDFIAFDTVNDPEDTPENYGTRINGLKWGVATQSVDGKSEYLHVLIAPSGDTLTILAPADGKTFSSAVNLLTGNAVALEQTESQVSLTLDSSDSWDVVDTVVKLTVD